MLKLSLLILFLIICVIMTIHHDSFAVSYGYKNGVVPPPNVFQVKLSNSQIEEGIKFVFENYKDNTLHRLNIYFKTVNLVESHAIKASYYLLLAIVTLIILIFEIIEKKYLKKKSC